MMNISALRSLEIRKNGVVKHHVADGRLCVVRKKLCHFVESAHVAWTHKASAGPMCCGLIGYKCVGSC